MKAYLEPHKEFLLVLLGAFTLAFAFLSGVLEYHVAFTTSMLVPVLTGGSIGRLLGWKGVAGIAALLALSVALTWYGFTIMLVIALLTGGFGAKTRSEDGI